MRPLALCALPLLAVVSASCLLSGGRSRVQSGNVYVAGNPTYDAYFRDVHALQTSAGRLPEARRNSRKPLCDELKTSCDAPDATLAQLTHERMVEVTRGAGAFSLELVGDDARLVPAGKATPPAAARPLFRAVEVTARAELDRARRLRATSMKLDQVLRTGHELEPRVNGDFTRQGAGKASEVRSELRASFDVLTPQANTVRAMAQGAEDFVLDLKRAIVTAPGLPASPAPGGPRPRSNGPKAAPKSGGAGEPAPKPAPAKPAAEPPPAESTEEAPKPKKPPPPAEEVFNP